MKKLLLSTCAFVLAGVVQPAWAQTAPTQRAAAGNVVGEVVVTAERRTQSVQKSSLAIQVLNPDQLRDAGVSQIRDLTAVNPGVNIGQGGPATQIYIRGVGDFGSTPLFNPAVATNIDGVYVARNNAIEGNMFDLQRVEVLKGPQGTLYGRNAAGGALNIITNPAQLGKLNGGLNVELGDYSEVNVDGFVNVPIGDTLAIRGAFQSVSRNGYSSMGFDDDHKQGYRVNATWKPTDDMQLKIGGAYSHVGGIGPGYNFDTVLDPRVVSALNSIGVTVPTNKRLSMTDPRAANVMLGIDALTAFLQPPFNTMVSSGSNPLAVAGGGPAPGSVGVYCLTQAQVNAGMVQGVATPLPVTTRGYCNAVAARIGVVNPNYWAVFDPNQWQKSAHQNNNYWNLNTEFTWNLPFANLTVIPAYRQVHNDYTTFPNTVYDDGGAYPPEQSISKSLEVRLAKDTSLVDWTVGLYGFQERQHNTVGSLLNENVGSVNSNGYTNLRIITSNEAVFGQATWHVSDQLRLITGARYGEETKELEGAQFLAFPGIAGFATPSRIDCRTSPSGYCLNSQYRGKTTSSAFNWKVGAEYDITPVNMVFATASTGFKAGGPNQVAIPNTGFVRVINAVGQSAGYDTTTSYLPEKLTAFEVGSRNRFLDGALQVNLEGFYWKYKQHQDLVNATVPDPTLGLPLTINIGGTQNTGDATIYGANIDVVYRFTPQDTFRFVTEYNHTNYDSFTTKLSNVVAGLTIGCPISPSVVAGTVNVNCSGRPLVRAPEWTGTVSYLHTFELANGGTIDAQATGQYASKSYLAITYLPQDIAPSYLKVDLNATYHDPSGNWTFQVWGRNLTNEDIFNGAFHNPGTHPNFKVVNIAAPRTFGVRMGVKF